MRLEELFEATEKKGTYAAAKFDSDSKKVIVDFVKDNEIPSPLDTDKLHCTVIFSKAHIPNFKAAGKYDEPMECKPDGFEVWNTRTEGVRCLVLKLKCPELVARHKALMKEYPEATYDYDKFKVHVTISYNIGEMDIKNLPEIKQSLMLVSEYTNPLDDTFAKKNSSK